LPLRQGQLAAGNRATAFEGEIKMPITKQFTLHRTPFYSDRSIPGTTVTMMYDPGTETRTITAVNRDDLLQQMSAFGAELGRACDVSQEHLGRGPGFMKLARRVRCCADNTPDEEYGRRICLEHLEQARQRL
jgi:hypothetical protein